MSLSPHTAPTLGTVTASLDSDAVALINTLSRYRRETRASTRARIWRQLDRLAGRIAYGETDLDMLPDSADLDVAELVDTYTESEES